MKQLIPMFALMALTISPALKAQSIPVVWCVASHNLTSTTEFSAVGCDDLKGLGASWNKVQGPLTFTAANLLVATLRVVRPSDWCVYQRSVSTNTIEFTAAQCSPPGPPLAGWTVLGKNVSFAVASAMVAALRTARTRGDWCVYRRPANGAFEFTEALCSPPGPGLTAEWQLVAKDLSFAAGSVLVASLKAGQTNGDWCVYRRPANGAFEFTTAQCSQAMPGWELLVRNLAFATASSMVTSLRTAQTIGDWCVYRRPANGAFDFTAAQCSQAMPGWQLLARDLSFAAAQAMIAAARGAQTTGDWCVYRRRANGAFEFTAAKCDPGLSAEWERWAKDLSFSAATAMVAFLTGAQTTGDWCVYRRVVPGTASTLQSTVSRCSDPMPGWGAPLGRTLSFAAAVTLLNSLGLSPSRPTPTPTPPPNPPQGSVCNGTFHTPDGGVYYLTVVGGKVTGTYQAGPGPHSSLRGTIQGTVSGNTVSADYSAREGQVTGNGKMSLICGPDGKISVSYRSSDGSKQGTSDPPNPTPPAPPTPPVPPAPGKLTVQLIETKPDDRKDSGFKVGDGNITMTTPTYSGQITWNPPKSMDSSGVAISIQTLARNNGSSSGIKVAGGVSGDFVIETAAGAPWSGEMAPVYAQGLHESKSGSVQLKVRPNLPLTSGQELQLRIGFAFGPAVTYRFRVSGSK